MQKRFFSTKKLVFVSLLIALEIILTRFLSIQTPITRIGFGFIAIAITGALFGPVVGGVAGLLADLIGMALFPAAAYFPGFSLSAFLTGVNYGFWFHNKEITLRRVLLACGTHSLIIALGLNTLWLNIISGASFPVLYATRIPNEAFLFAVRSASALIVMPRIVSELRKLYRGALTAKL